MSEDKENKDSAALTVLKFIIQGQAETDIKEFLSTAGLSAEDAAKAIEGAFDELEKTLDISQEIRRAWCLEALRDIYRQMLDIHDYPGAIRAVVEISKLSAKPVITAPREKRVSKEEKGDAISKLTSKKILTIPRK